MLPFGGQGSNAAMEDAGALGYLLKSVATGEDLSKILTAFDKVRRKRVSRVQVMSKVRAGKEQKVQEELSQYADPPGSGKIFLIEYMDLDAETSIAVPGSFAERTAHDYG